MFRFTRKAKIAHTLSVESLRRTAVNARVRATYALPLDMVVLLCTADGPWCDRTDIHAEHDAMLYRYFEDLSAKALER